jgi:hypothetical protein
MHSIDNKPLWVGVISENRENLVGTPNCWLTIDAAGWRIDDDRNIFYSQFGPWSCIRDQHSRNLTGYSVGLYRRIKVFEPINWLRCRVAAVDYVKCDGQVGSVKNTAR